MADIDSKHAGIRGIRDPEAPAAAYQSAAGTGTDAVPDHAQSLPGEAATAVSGRVGTWEEAAVLRARLIESGISDSDIEVFYTGPAGRHAVTALGGDSHADAGSTNRGTGAVAGGAAGAAIGLAVGATVAAAPMAVPVLLTAAAVGAFGGALVGGVATTDETTRADDTPQHPVGKPAGVVIAVRVDHRPEDEAIAMRCLNHGGAIELERSPARWSDGSWIDWDPVAVREQISPEPGTPQA
jgi:hypothetical protein